MADLAPCPFCGGVHAPNDLALSKPISSTEETSKSVVVSMADPSAASSTPAALSFEASTLLLGGTYMWNSGAPVGTPMYVTYSFMNQVPAYETLYYTAGGGAFQALNATQQAAARQALAAWSAVSGVTFVEVPDAVGGDIRFGMHQMQTGVGGYAFYPNTSGNTVLEAGGDIFFNTAYLANDAFSPGTYGFLALLHEIGHALGLKHPFEGSPVLSSWLDNTTNTVMSYTFSVYPNQPQNFDVQAIQYLYGSRAAANSDAIATYWDAAGLRLGTVGSTAGETLIGINLSDLLYGQAGNDTIYGRAGADMLDGGTGADLLYGGDGDDTIMLIADGDVANGEGGNNTVNFSQAPGGVMVNLATGMSQLTAGGPVDALYNFREVIGSNYDDDLTGNASFNMLRGGAGNDTLTGNGGGDVLDGGAGADIMIGGSGTNTFYVDDVGDQVISNSGTDIVYSTVAWTLSAGIAYITLLSGASSAVGNAAANRMTGNSGANTLQGLDGNDILLGEGGNDTLSGGGGTDELHGGDGEDWIEGEAGSQAFAGVAGNDTIYGENGNDTVLAGDGNDLIFGGFGTDALVGEEGNDVLYGEGDWDLMDGRDGTDSLYGGAGGDIIFGDMGDDLIYGDDGDDLIMGERGENTTLGNNDTILGGWGNDMLDGSAGDDLILGEQGNDIIDGDEGNDRIVGGVGNEIIAGSAYNNVSGQDQFIYLSIAEGGDSIYGFRTTAGNNDFIDFRAIFNTAGYTGMAPRSDGYMLIQEGGGSTYIYCDGNGPAGGGNWTWMATLVGTSLSSGQLPIDNYFLYQ
jgi:Ca2+-binding RTX toxin-like protein